MLRVGSHAPAFTARDQNGRKVSLADFKGKTVVLWFYPKADTPGWTDEGKGFRDEIHQFESKNAVVLGISFDTPEDNRAFAKKFHFPFLLLSDPERRIGLEYHAAGDPDQAYADRITYVIGPEGNIVQAYDKVDVRTHAAGILAAL